MTPIVARFIVENHAGHEGGHYMTVTNFTTFFCVGHSVNVGWLPRPKMQLHDCGRGYPLKLQNWVVSSSGEVYCNFKKSLSEQL